jgi:hypothetical protein
MGLAILKADRNQADFVNNKLINLGLSPAVS